MQNGGGRRFNLKLFYKKVQLGTYPRNLLHWLSAVRLSFLRYFESFADCHNYCCYVKIILLVKKSDIGVATLKKGL